MVVLAETLRFERRDGAPIREDDARRSLFLLFPSGDQLPPASGFGAPTPKRYPGTRLGPTFLAVRRALTRGWRAPVLGQVHRGGSRANPDEDPGWCTSRQTRSGRNAERGAQRP